MWWIISKKKVWSDLSDMTWKINQNAKCRWNIKNYEENFYIEKQTILRLFIDQSLKNDSLSKFQKISRAKRKDWRDQCGEVPVDWSPGGGCPATRTARGPLGPEGCPQGAGRPQGPGTGKIQEGSTGINGMHHVLTTHVTKLSYKLSRKYTVILHLDQGKHLSMNNMIPNYRNSKKYYFLCRKFGTCCCICFLKFAYYWSFGGFREWKNTDFSSWYQAL